jgi:large subunit ribosomal protein L18
MTLNKLERRKRIKMRIRKVVTGTPERPRLSVYRSNKEFYAQLIDDKNGVTITSVGTLGDKSAESQNKVQAAATLGAKAAQLVLEKGINEVVFDRNGYLYHGRVKAFAEALREGGIKF